jgi:hypothetical protein
MDLGLRGLSLLVAVALATRADAPDRTAALVGRIDRWLADNGRSLAIVICSGLGLFLIARGIAPA